MTSVDRQVGDDGMDSGWAGEAESNYLLGYRTGNNQTVDNGQTAMAMIGSSLA